MEANSVLNEPRMKWYEVWWHVWSNPGPEAFRTILRDPGANAYRGFLWLGIMSLIIPVASLFVSREVFTLLCMFFLSPIMAVIGLAITAAIYHLVAKLFGGGGTWDRLTYALAAVYAPSTLLALPGLLLAPLFNNSISNASPFQNMLIPVVLIGIISLVVGIYTLVLYISAIEGVENIGIGMAILTYFLPSIIAVVLMSCLFFALGGLALFQGAQYYNP